MSNPTQDELHRLRQAVLGTASKFGFSSRCDGTRLLGVLKFWKTLASLRL